MKILSKLFGSFFIVVIIGFFGTNILKIVAVNHVNGISGKNHENIDAIICEVSQFKVE